MVTRALLAAVVLAGALAGCEDDIVRGGRPDAGGGAGDGGVGFSRTAMLRDVSTGVIVPTLREFEAAAGELARAVAAWDGGDGAARDAAKAAWNDAMTIWQRVEVMQIGPTGSSIHRVGGQDLRDEIYSWPTVNACRVDQVLVAGDYERDDFFDRVIVNAYGLDALEYLLFYAGNDNNCRPQLPINRDGTWDALGDAERRRRRAAYAQVVATRLVADAGRVVQAWAPDGGNFVQRLADASAYDDARHAVDELFAAMYFVELTVKDRKLVEPLCLTPDCPVADGLWADKIESPWARRSVAHVAANLQGFRALFTGGDGLGFDDYLRHVGAGDLADRMLAATDAAIAAAERHGPSLEIEDRPLYDAVKGLTDLLKSQFVTALNLRVPQEGAGDND